ncbi:response regulator [Anthocerotibacter panamensis]|uniref:response regulator n=1 Tax=Anthocerotibacter panamensis TaxID=2857077 RepID=UPI001C402B57|nr:response regulator transcription factor [Anthocerotibacter panamensis]
MKKIKVLIADDHALIRSGIRIMLLTANDMTVVGEASDGEEAMQLYDRLKPDVLLLDISMPTLDGIEVTRLLKQRYPEAKILIVTMHESEEYLFRIMRAGASGYLLKNSDKQELLQAIRSVAAGEQTFSAAISRLMTEKYVREAQQSAQQKVPHVEQRPVRPNLGAQNIHLTNREWEIFTLVAEGYTNQEIARQLSISPRTVDTHRNNLMKKLRIKNTAGLVRFALEQGLTSSSERMVRPDRSSSSDSTPVQ